MSDNVERDLTDRLYGDLSVPGGTEGPEDRMQPVAVESEGEDDARTLERIADGLSKDGYPVTYKLLREIAARRRAQESEGERDIVGRLREQAQILEANGRGGDYLNEAADEIEALRAQESEPSGGYVRYVELFDYNRIGKDNAADVRLASDPRYLSAAAYDSDAYMRVRVLPLTDAPITPGEPRDG